MNRLYADKHELECYLVAKKAISERAEAEIAAAHKAVTPWKPNKE